jgi:hypothetical protein
MTIVVRAYDGIIWAALFNTLPQNSGQAFTEIDTVLWKARDQVTTWPTNNLFSIPVPQFEINQTIVLVLTLDASALLRNRRTVHASSS